MASARRPRLTWRKEPRATGLSTIGASRYPRGDELCFGGNGLASVRPLDQEGRRWYWSCPST